MIESQVKALYRYWPDQAEWFVIGGPSVDLEAQAVKERYPHVKCIGFEPNTESVRKQTHELAFPGPLFPYALWRKNEKVMLDIPQRGSQCGSICRPDNCPEAWTPVTAEKYEVQGRTLDSLSDEYGPFNNAVLWLDIEYAELYALQAADRLLSRTLLLNVETFNHRALPDINRILYRHKLILRQVWNFGQHATSDAQDYVYIREDLWK